MRNHTRGCGVMAFGAAAIAMTCGAPAQEPASGGLEEIVVTARRVDESLQRTPVAVSAFLAEDLEQRSIARVGETAAFTPNFVTSAGPTGQDDGFFFVRGVGQVDLNPATDPGVATYIDGVYLGRLMGASFETMDIERIEVLRGPQGTLFGRNTMGGAVNVVTRDPAQNFNGRLKVFGGDRDLYGGRLGVDIPLGDSVALALSGMYKNQDGWGKRASDGTIFNSSETSTGRAKLKWNASDSFSATLSADITSADGTSQHQILTGFNGAAVSPLGVPIPAGIGNSLQPGVSFVNNSSTPDPEYSLDTQGASLQLDWDTGGLAFKSITAYRELEHFSADDFDGSPFTFYDHSFDTEQDQFSQEFQLSGETDRFTWLVGAYYYEESVYHNNSIALGGNNGCLPFPVPGNQYPFCGAIGQPYATPGVQRFIRNNQQFDLDITAQALFAHATWRFTDRWSLSAGIRWTDEEKDQQYDFFIDNTRNVANLANLPPIILPTLSPRNPFLTVPSRYEESWDDITPQGSLEFQATDDVLFYVSYAEGFKSGGFNGRPSPNQQGQFAPVEAYDPEQLKTAELGVKSQLWDDRVRLNALVYFSDYEGIQLLVLDPLTGFFRTDNAEAEIKGAELELLARLTPSLEVQGSFGYTDTEYTELNPLSGIPADGVLPVTPEWTASLGAQYTWFLADDASFSLRGDYSYRDDVFYGATNLPNEFQEGFGLFNARATWTAPGGQLKLAAYGRNLTDEEYFSNGQDVVGPLGVAFAGVGAPREWGVELEYRFGD